jgi:hypothetical protein
VVQTPVVDSKLLIERAFNQFHMLGQDYYYGENDDYEVGSGNGDNSCFKHPLYSYNANLAYQAPLTQRVVENTPLEEG